MINRFFFCFVLFLCSIVLCMSILLTLSGRHPHYPCFIQHFKRKTWVDGPCSGVRENKGIFKMRGMIFFQVRWQQKNEGKIKKVDERRHEMHSFTSTLPHLLSFIFSSFSLFLFLRDGGFPVTWVLGSPVLILSLVVHQISFSFSLIIIHFMSLCLQLPVSSFLSFFCFCSSLCQVSWAFYHCVAACLWQGSLAGRKAGWWPLRSWVTQVRCKRCPWGACVSYLCGMPENTHPLS